MEKIDRSKGMQQICKTLEIRGFNFADFNALDVFARKGDWQTFVYANKVKTLELWEIDKQFEIDLKTNFPNANVKITDSIKEIQNDSIKKYNFIVIDNPQGCFGHDNNYCEHFDILPNLINIIDNNAIVIFNINTSPFNYNNFSEWQKRRNEFYQLSDTSRLNFEFLEKFYEDFFLKLSFETEFHFNIFREECKPYNYLYYFIFFLKK